MDASAPVLLRPLGIGEIIDRALTVYVRNFVALTATVLIVIFVPLALAQYFLLGAQAGAFQSMFDVFRHAASGTPASPQALERLISYPELMLGYAFEVVTVVLSPFAFNAVAAGVASIYAGRRPSIGASLATVFARWMQLLGLLAVEILMVAGAYFVIVVLGVGIVVGSIAAANAFPDLARSPLTITALVLFGLALLVALCVVCGLCALCMLFAGYAVVIERKSVMASVGSGFERIFNRQEWGKALVLMLVALLVAWGIGTLGAIAEFVVLFIRGLQAVAAVVSALVAVVSWAVQMAFYSVYYYDVRIRREGLDLDMALQGLGTSAAQVSYAATNLASGDERALVHRFLERRTALPAKKRAELAERLAQRIRSRVGPDLARLDDEGLLERL
jgi:hypothetical protein